MKASSDHELEIARLVDQRAIEHRLPLSAVAEIATAIPFAMSEAETQFLIRYIIWRRDHPIASSIMDSRTAAILAHPPHPGHIVYPYTDDRGLVDVVGFYTSNGLARGNAVILIATEAHVYAIKRYLKSDGNVEAFEASGQLSFLDAVELMSVFMVDGNPEPKLFKEGIKTLIERQRLNRNSGCEAA